MQLQLLFLNKMLIFFRESVVPIFQALLYFILNSHLLAFSNHERQFTHIILWIILQSCSTIQISNVFISKMLTSFPYYFYFSQFNYIWSWIYYYLRLWYGEHFLKVIVIFEKKYYSQVYGPALRTLNSKVL